MMGQCGLCSNEVSPEAMHHEKCNAEYWRRVKRRVCVRCGGEERGRTLMCDMCAANSNAPYVGYAGGAP